MPRARQLNETCACESRSAAALDAFFSNAPVFLSAAHREQMERLISAVHRVAGLPDYQRWVLAEAPEIARLARPTHGVFTGFDFHVGAEGPRLIEINTNAGGAMLNAVAEWRYPECCVGGGAARLPPGRASLESQFLAMFRNEWRLARGDRPLRTLVIVDDDPGHQFLRPEFELFAKLFDAHGIDAFIADARELTYSAGALRAGDRVVDLVYNRVTDFYFEEPSHDALRRAWIDDAAVITPHPRAHALLADKRNLVRFTDAEFLAKVGVSEEDIAILRAVIPLTRDVAGSAEDWWRDRKGWFFKPASGFGSRGAYRGDKITRRVFDDVMQGDYVAQRLAAPGERLRMVSGDSQRFKVDLRCYVYDGVIQLMAARLYQGQTTNFRTAGGGFAPVVELLIGE